MFNEEEKLMQDVVKCQQKRNDFTLEIFICSREILKTNISSQNVGVEKLKLNIFRVKKIRSTPFIKLGPD